MAKKEEKEIEEMTEEERLLIGRTLIGNILTKYNLQLATSLEAKK